MVLLICEDCGSNKVMCKSDGIDSITGEDRYHLQCRDCFTEWYDIETDINFDDIDLDDSSAF